MTKIDTRFPVLLGLGLLLASGLVGQQSQLAGSVPTGTASSTPLALTLRDAIERGLKTNLRTLTSATASEIARGQRQRAISALLPEAHGQISEIDQQLNLKTFGLNFPGVPPIAGPFHYTDLRAFASMSVFDYGARKTYKAAQENLRAAQLSIQDARDLVVQAVAGGYLQIIADASRVAAIRSQVLTDQALYDRAVDRKKAGTSAGIDVLRSQVELKQQQQRLLAQENQLAKDKLALGRAIGLPPGQEFTIAESAPYSPLAATTADQALRKCAPPRRRSKRRTPSATQSRESPPTTATSAPPSRIPMARSPWPVR